RRGRLRARGEGGCRRGAAHGRRPRGRARRHARQRHRHRRRGRLGGERVRYEGGRLEARTPAPLILPTPHLSPLLSPFLLFLSAIFTRVPSLRLLSPWLLLPTTSS